MPPELDEVDHQTQTRKRKLKDLCDPSKKKLGLPRRPPVRSKDELKLMMRLAARKKQHANTMNARRETKRVVRKKQHANGKKPKQGV